MIISKFLEGTDKKWSNKSVRVPDERIKAYEKNNKDVIRLMKERNDCK